MDKNTYREHWEKVFLNKDTSQVSWYQDAPETSLKLIHQYASNKSASIIDIGGGDSRLPDHLVKLEYKNISILDISIQALVASKTRMGEDGDKVSWIVDNVLDLHTDGTFNIWHDRAVFHFIQGVKDQRIYKDIVLRELAVGGILILATFSKNDGPIKCSGLDVHQHDKHSISALFNPEFDLIESFEELHQTPSGHFQNFNWSVLKRNKK